MSFDDQAKTAQDSGVKSAAERHADLRQRIADHIGSGSLSQTAEQIGTGESTLRAFIKGDYRGNYDNVAAQVEKYFTSLAEKSRFVMSARPGFMPTSVYARIRTQLAWAHAGNMTTVTGDSGVGKTVAARRYVETNSNVWLLTGSDAISSTTAVLKRLCQIMRLPQKTTGVGPDLMTMAIRDFVTGKGGLIIADEVSFLKDGAIEELRAIHDETGVGVAVMGQGDVIAGGAGKIKGAQLKRRMSSRVMIDTPEAGDAEMLLDAWQIADPAQRAFLTEIALTPGLGALGSMTQVLEYASMIVGQSGESINLALLRHSAAHHGVLGQMKRRK